jgi:amino acid transporter
MRLVIEKEELMPESGTPQGLKGRTAPPVPSRSDATLRSGSLKTLGAAIMGATFMGLAATEYIILGPMTSDAGQAAALMYLIGIVVAIPTAISYGMLVRVKPSSGSTFAWTRAAFNPSLGAYAGWSVLGFYVINAWLLPIQAGLFFSAFLAYFGVTASFGTFAIGVIASVLGLALIVYPGVRISSRVTVIMAAIEVGIMFALAQTIILVQRGSLTPHPLEPTFLSGGTGLYNALILTILVFTGFDVTATLTEETTEKALKKIPAAIVLTVVVVGLIWFAATAAFEFSAPTHTIVSLTSSGLTPMAVISKHYWSAGALLVAITGLTGSTATFVAITTGASRVLYSMGRDRFLPARFGWVHPKHRTPWNALHLVLASSLAAALLSAALLGTFNSFNWIASAVVFFALITYVFTNLSNLVYYRRFAPHRRRVLPNVVAPVIGILIACAMLALGFFRSDWNAGFEMGRSIVIFCVLVAVIGIAYVVLLRRRNPEVLESMTLEDQPTH